MGAMQLGAEHGYVGVAHWLQWALDSQVADGAGRGSGATALGPPIDVEGGQAAGAQEGEQRRRGGAQGGGWGRRHKEGLKLGRGSPVGGGDREPGSGIWRLGGEMRKS